MVLAKQLHEQLARSESDPILTHCHADEVIQSGHTHRFISPGDRSNCCRWGNSRCLCPFMNHCTVALSRFGFLAEFQSGNDGFVLCNAEQFSSCMTALLWFCSNFFLFS